MEFDRYDIVTAHYQFCVDYHSSQWSSLYARLSRIRRYFRPSPLWKGYESLSDNGKAIYDSLLASVKERYIPN
jgi:hypothetical protein